ncbi:MAG TPA: hypothetical protein VMX57_04735 [Planctomycetota bacterium]|nr:hypothetical protein [Planctomycetota bacterium]
MTTGFHAAAPWRRNRKLVKSGFRDLAYLPRSRTGWNATLSALAYSVRRHVTGSADLSLWAAMHGVAPGTRYAELGRHALVLWHGTSAERASKIRTTGLFHKGGLWTAFDPNIAHNFARNRHDAFRAGSAMIVLVLDRREVQPDVHYEQESPEVLRFHRGLSADAIEYVLFDDRIEFTGAARSRQPKPWGVARFKRKEGRWVPRSDPPVRFDDAHDYATFDEWLGLSLRRILDTLGQASAVEVFSSLYATLDPTDALEHDTILEACDRLCGKPRQRKGFRLFSLADKPPVHEPREKR